jgi:hypothetical protein
LWLHNAEWAALLGRLADEYEEITHAHLDAFPQRRHVQYLRQVLVNIEALPYREEMIDGNMPWLDQLLTGQGAETSRIVRPYAVWSVLRRARSRPHPHQPTRSVRKYARGRIRLAVNFLNWLDTHGTSLAQVRQGDVDRWLEEGSVNHYRLRDFLLWARARGLAGQVEIPWLPRSDPENVLDTDTRWQLLRTCLHDTTVPTVLRAAGALILLYAQTPTRIVHLTREDLTTRAEHNYLTLGRQPVVLPPKLADLLHELAETATRARTPRIEREHPDEQWLFPSTYPGQLADPGRIADQLVQELSLYTRPARASALCTLAEDLPAPVLAELLDVHITTAIRWTHLVKRDWSSYLAARADQNAALSPPASTLDR